MTTMAQAGEPPYLKQKVLIPELNSDDMMPDDRTII
jgi:hypothetical protein